MEHEEEQRRLKLGELTEEAAELEERRKQRILRETEERELEEAQALLEDTKNCMKKGKNKTLLDGEKVTKEGSLSKAPEEDKSAGSVPRTQPDVAKESKSDGEAANEHILTLIPFLEKVKKLMPLDAQGKNYADGYIHCLTNFYSIPETVSYMTTVHGLSKEEVKKSFVKYQASEGGRAYMRFSAECAKRRRDHLL